MDSSITLIMALLDYWMKRLEILVGIPNSLK